MSGLVKHASRLTVFNGLATNTVSHFDGQVFSVTGRHLTGGQPSQPSIDVAIGNEFGTSQLLPVVSVTYPSYRLCPNIDPRATPLRISSIGTIAESLTRSAAYDTAAQRDRVGVVLSEEARDLAAIANDPTAMNGMALQYDALRNILAKNLQADFSQTQLQTLHPEFNYKALKFQQAGAVNAAFALEAFRQNIARCVSFDFGSFDTHFKNYSSQALTQQEMFDTLATFIDQLDAIDHPTLSGHKLSEHTHIMVTSDFCRTPQINISGGRDHYPNGSCLLFSPKFKGGTQFGSSDPEQLLPNDIDGVFAGGARAVGSPDVLATFLSAFGIDPQKYFRDGQPVKSMLGAV